MIVAEMLDHAWHQSKGTLSLRIVWICTVLFVCTTLLDLLGLSTRNHTIALLGLSYNGLVHQGFFFQFLTAPLMHVNISHLIFNMLCLWMLGPSVEHRLGRIRYFLFSFFCASAGLVGFLLLAGQGHAVVLGYSGVIFGILTAQAVYYPDSRMTFYGFFRMKMKYAVLLMGAVELYLTISPEGGGIAHSAHLFGAAAAFLFLRIQSWKHTRGSQRMKPREPLVFRRPPQPSKRPELPREL